MNNTALALAVIFAGPALDAVAQGGRIGDDRAVARKYGWVFNYDEARQQARKANRPLMVVLRCVP